MDSASSASAGSRRRPSAANRRVRSTGTVVARGACGSVEQRAIAARGGDDLERGAAEAGIHAAGIGEVRVHELARVGLDARIVPVDGEPPEERRAQRGHRLGLARPRSGADALERLAERPLDVGRERARASPA
jgi:hypothetical protein